MLRSIPLLVISLILAFATYAQADNRAPYLQVPSVPPLNIRLVPDSNAFTKKDLKKKRPVMIFLFSPDCDHCHHATEELIANIDLYKKVQVIMVSALDFEATKKFYDDFKIAGYPNIKVGRDAAYFLGSFYKNSAYPAIYLYDKKGRFIKAYEAPASFVKMAEELLH